MKLRRMQPPLLLCGIWIYALCSQLSFASTAVNDSYTINPQLGKEHMVVTYNDSVFLDSEEALNSVLITSISALSDPSAGTIEIDTDDKLSINYTPTPSFSGTVTFTYTLQDFIGSSTATVTMTVDSNATTLQAVDDAYYSVGQPVAIYPIENDVKPVTSDSATVTVTTPSIGTITTVSSKGLFTYTPPPNLDGQTTATFNYTVSYPGFGSDQATVTINIDPSGAPLSNAAETPEQLSVGKALDVACAQNSDPSNPTPDSAFQATCTELAGLSDSEKRSALDQILPTQISQQSNAIAQLATLQTGNLQQRLSNLRAGSRGVSLSGLTSNINGKSLAIGDILDAELGVSGGNAGDDSKFDGKLGIFITGSIATGDRDATTNIEGFDFETQSITAGADYRLRDNLILGLAFGITDAESDTKGSDSSFNSDGISLSTYGNWYPRGNIYVDWIATYGDNDYDSQRQITFGSQTTQAVGDTEGGQWNLSTSSGYEFQLKSWTLGGFGRISYMEAEIKSYSETGGAGLALNIDRQVIRSLPVSLGARVDRVFSIPIGILIPLVELEWVHELKDDPRVVTSTFVRSPGSGTFYTSTDAPDSDYFDLSLSVSGVFEGGHSAFIRYGTELAREDVSLSIVEGGYRLEF